MSIKSLIDCRVTAPEKLLTPGAFDRLTRKMRIPTTKKETIRVVDSNDDGKYVLAIESCPGITYSARDANGTVVNAGDLQRAAIVISTTSEVVITYKAA